MAVMRNSIIFGGVDSADFGIYIGGEGTFNAPKRDVEMISIPGRNGAFALDKGRFQNIDVVYSAFNFEQDLATFAQNLSDFRNAICSHKGYQRLTDTFHQDEYRMAAYVDGLEIKPIDFNTASTFDITFDCKPQRYLLSGEEPVTIGEWHETETASGSIASFEAEAGDAVKSLLADINPIQSLNGYDKPWAGGAGKNKLYLAPQTLTDRGITWKVNADGTVTATGTLSSTNSAVYINATVPTGSYKFNGSGSGASSSTYYAQVVDGSTWSNPDYGGVDVNVTIATTNVRIYFATKVNPPIGGITFKPMMRLATETDATWQPYSNICPISGYSSVEVTVADDHDSPTVSNTYTIDLNGTRYGGTLDVVSGVLTVTDGNIASYNGETLPSTWISDRDVYASGTTPTTGAQVVYKLATPTTVQLTAEEVELLVGLNQVWANSGDVSVEYGTAPNVLVNPTLFESSPMLEVTGYGGININADAITVENVPLGEIKIGNSAQTASVTLDVSNLNSGDAIFSNSNTAPYATLTIKKSSQSGQLKVDLRSSVTNGSAHVVKSGTYSYRVLVYPFTSGGISFVKGTNGTITTTVPLRVEINDVVTNCTLTLTTAYNASTNKITMSLTRTDFPSSGLGYSSEYQHPAYYGDSTKTILPQPMYIDLDIGEAYGIVDDEMVSFNNTVQIPAELPKLKSGVNTIGTDNTITDLKVVPHYWKI